MNLYRLDIQYPNGSTEPVADFAGPRLIRVSKTADSEGQRIANLRGLPVHKTRIQGAGHLKRMRTFGPYYSNR